MKTNRWIECSQRVYLQLLRFYPQEYREAYEMEMFCLFTDQCRDAYKQHGKQGILALWPRTLLDVGITATREHLLDPQAGTGLLETKLDAPLPWKGVLLVLIPGLIFFISQIVQLTSTKDWFFLVYYRAAYFLILPVLLVWLLTRRFPIWGLIPLGLLYTTLWSYIERVGISNLPFLGHLFSNAERFPSEKNYLIAISEKHLILTIVCIILLSALIWHNSRYHQISQAAWQWLGVCGLLIVFQISLAAYRFTAAEGLDSIEMKLDLTQLLLAYAYGSLAFLLLVFIGTFFARRHGGFSFLFLLGYLLPTVIFGRYGDWTDIVPFSLVSITVLIYRFVVAIVAPIWLVRAASIPKRQRAAAVPVAIALLSEIFLTIVNSFAMANQVGYQASLLGVLLTIWSQLFIVAGLGLAVSLYMPSVQTATSSPMSATMM